jgi:hypothetical protein
MIGGACGQVPLGEPPSKSASVALTFPPKLRVERNETSRVESHETSGYFRFLRKNAMVIGQACLAASRFAGWS